METDIQRPSALILPLVADCTAAAFYNGDTGCLAFDVNATKLGFVTAKGATEETVQSA